MKRGEEFEIRCCNYLNDTYRNEGVVFLREGGMDSTKSDIAVVKNARTVFYIEVKDATAQSGQFVLIPDKEKKKFVFSPRNRSEQNEMVETIIAYMNSDFEKFCAAGTSGESLNIDSSIFSSWIVEHYRSKNVKYVISGRKNEYVILPIQKFRGYFYISAIYRIKKSGSNPPPKRDILSIQKKVESLCSSAIFRYEDGKLFVTISNCLPRDRFKLGDNTYYFSSLGDDEYEIRKLSNTNNMNVIFSIELNRSQDPEDLAEFERDLQN